MNITVQSVSPRDSFGMVLVEVSVRATRPTNVVDGATFDLFIEATTDSFAEIRRRSLEKMRTMAQEILDAPAVECDEDQRLEVSSKLLDELQKKIEESTIDESSPLE